jgi:hypothetical protein
MSIEILKDIPVREVGGREGAFSGLSYKQGVPDPFRICKPEALEWGEIRQFTGDLGRLCERRVLEVLRGTWSKSIGENQGEVRKVHKAMTSLLADEVEIEVFTDEGIETMIMSLKDVAQRTYSHADIAPFYQELAFPYVEIEEGIVEPQNQHLHTLFTGVDRILKTDLMGMYASLPQEGDDKVGSNVRYLVEAGLILAKLVCSPHEGLFDTLGGRIVRNIRYSYFQFDALLVVDGNSDSESFDFYQFLQSGKPYAICEMKVPFRTCYTTGPNKLRRPIRRHLRSFQEKLGNIALSWIERGGVFFPFPKFVDFVYLRGTLPHVPHRIFLDEIYFQNWADFLEEKLRRDLILDFDVADDVRRLIGILDFARKELQNQREIRYRSDLERLKQDMEKGFKQETFF